jgi:hypothetical protein
LPFSLNLVPFYNATHIGSHILILVLKGIHSGEHKEHGIGMYLIGGLIFPVFFYGFGLTAILHAFHVNGW